MMKKILILLWILLIPSTYSDYTTAPYQVDFEYYTITRWYTWDW